MGAQATDSGLRVQARELIADATSPITFLMAQFSGVSRALASGDGYALMQTGFKHGATMMLEECKANCPVDTGELRDSLYVTTEDASGEVHDSGHTKMDRHAPGHVGSLSVKNTFAYITTDVHYAYFLEYGTRYMPARPFLRPAIDQGFGATVNTIADFVVLHVVAGLMTGFVANFGILAANLADIALKHASAHKQKHGLAWDVTGAAAEHVGGRIAGRALRGLKGAKAVAKSGPRAPRRPGKGK